MELRSPTISTLSALFLKILASSHALRACNEAFLLVKKQKNSVILFFIYNFYFDNLIYK